jgi:hypothetical protein
LIKSEDDSNLNLPDKYVAVSSTPYTEPEPYQQIISEQEIRNGLRDCLTKYNFKVWSR